MTTKKEEFLHLQHSESVVAQMAATVFSGLIQQQEMTQANEDAFVRKAVSIAVKLAVETEKAVKSDQEWVRKEGSAYLAG